MSKKVNINETYPHTAEVLVFVVRDARGLGNLPITFKPIALPPKLRAKFDAAEPCAAQLSGFQRRTIAWPLADDAKRLLKLYGKQGTALNQLARSAEPRGALAKLLEVVQ